jgi:hypothetical protein
MQIEFRQARASDVAIVAQRLRAADIEECRAQGVTPRAALRAGLSDSALCWTLLANGVPAAMLGVAPLRGEPGVGIPWFLGTDLVPRVAYMRLSAEYIAKMLGAFPHLLNYVHADNARSVRWLKRVGFSLADAKQMGPKNAMFHRFEMHAHDAPRHL